MPGYKITSGAWMENAWKYREVSAADLNTPAALDALPEIDMHARDFGRLNCIQVQVIIPAGVTAYDVEAYADTTYQDPTALLGPEKWSFVARRVGNTTSCYITLTDVPPGKVKVIIRNISGTVATSIKIFVARSA